MPCLVEFHIIRETAIKGMQDIFRNDSIAVSLINQVENHMATAYVAAADRAEIHQAMVSYRLRDIEILKKNKNHIIFNQVEDLPRFLNFFVRSDNQRFLVLPIFFDETPAATIILSRENMAEYKEENIIRARQMADQVAVALSNSQLLEELHTISWGTLTAFGRAVDAKSPWTAGHSERVAKLAVKIGRQMKLDEKKVDMLELSGILHDIGKIGVPAEILDKPGRLTMEEMEKIRKHPFIGACILEPIKVFSPVIPMIHQHHEQYGGNGYPGGLSGKEIDPGARILSVADAFDAMISNRPYRKAMTVERAVSIINNEAGKMFDPEVIKAFNEVVASEDFQPASGQEFIRHQIKFGT